LTGVFTVAPGSAFASSKGGTIWRWNGTTWSVSFNGTTCSLNAVWGSSASDVWVVGDGGTILHWDGSSWSERQSGTSLNLESVWGTSPSDAWFAGGNGDQTAPQGTILHWNGSLTSQSANGSLLGVWSDSPSDVWVVGTGTHAFQYAERGGVQGFQPVVIGTGEGSTGHIFGTGPSDIWVDGRHYDGTTWTAFDATLANMAVWGTSPTNAWGAGPGISYWKGTAWTAVAFPGGSALTYTAVSGSGASDVWAVGSAGVTAHFNGVSWTVIPL
jgi:hypothetical protein